MDDNTTSLRMVFFIKQFAVANLFVALFFFLLGSTNVIAQGNDIDTAREYIKQGKSFYYAEDFEKSIAYFDKAGIIAKKLKDDQLRSFVYTLKGNLYLREGKNQKALDAYYGSLDISQRLGDLEQEVVTNSGLIIVLKRMNQLERAIVIARKMIKSIDKTSFKDTRVHVNIITTVSEIYIDSEHYDSVQYYAEKGIAISKSLDYKEGLVDLYIKKGMIFYYKKNYDQSFKYLFKAQNILLTQDIKNKFYPTVNSNYFLAGCYYEKGLYDNAINQLLNTINVLEENDLTKPPVIQSHLLLANCYGEKKDLEKALYWHNKYLKLNENYQKDKDKTVNSIYEKETQKLESEIESLKNKHIIGERTKIYISIGFVFLSVILIGFVFRYFKKQKTNKLVFDDLMKKINHLESSEQESFNHKEMVSELIIDDDKIKEVLEGLDKLERQEFFLREDCNLTSMSKKVKTNVTYLSKIINTYKQKSFNEYINDLRIDYVVKRLKNDKKLRSFSIKSIAKEIGYKSDYSFAKHFKAKTGLYPSYYIKNIEKQNMTI